MVDGTFQELRRRPPRSRVRFWMYGSWLALVVVVAAAVVLGGLLPKIRRLNELWRRRAALETEAAEWRARREDLQRRRERFQSDAEFVERIAREYGRARTNEIVFKLVGSDMTMSDAVNRPTEGSPEGTP